jgi:hypothetical protein
MMTRFPNDTVIQSEMSENDGVGFSPIQLRNRLRRSWSPNGGTQPPRRQTNRFLQGRLPMRNEAKTLGTEKDKGVEEERIQEKSTSYIQKWHNVAIELPIITSEEREARMVW